MPTPARLPRSPLQVLAKPIGPFCNLDCDYCSYTNKEALFPTGHNFRMSDETLELFVRRYIESHDGPEVAFTWQGGEPTLCGISFFTKAVALQCRYATGRHISNTIQTNGTLLDHEWGFFLHDHQFQVGLSLDGPRHLHNRHRHDKQHQPAFDRVMRGLAILQKHRVPHHSLTVVSSTNAAYPLEVYRFLLEAGLRHLQFTPLVIRLPASDGAQPIHPAEYADVTPETVPATAYGIFLNRIFDHWVRHDVGQVHVGDFAHALATWRGQSTSLCIHAPDCGRTLLLNHDGSVYACQHYIEPNHRLGDLRDHALDTLAHSPTQRQFGRAKSATLPHQCRECSVRFACHGGCPKHRFTTTPDGEPGLNYLCHGYLAFFTHIDAPMRRMATLLKAQRSLADIMQSPQADPFL